MSGFLSKAKEMIGSQSAMAEVALNTITDGVIIIDADALIKFINPAAVQILGSETGGDVIGLNALGLLRLEGGDGMPIPEEQNPLRLAMQRNAAWTSHAYSLVTRQGRKTPLALTLTPSGSPSDDKVITLRNISKELEEEDDQLDFVSTASHEMRTPVASIEGYIGLALNPSTATIDDRARQYLEEAHTASQHLGRLFRDLLDVTKLEDNRMRVQLRPVEMRETVQRILDTRIAEMAKKRIKYSFGPANDRDKRVSQPIYAMIDLDFLREILDNLTENAIKYTPEGGSIWANVKTEGETVVINVTDTGIGIAPEDMAHIFQKFYRVDNSATREIGGTGLGLYLVKQRVEALGGRVWVESAFSQGSTFYVSFPRITADEYQRQLQILENVKAMGGAASAAPVNPAVAPVIPNAAPAPAPGAPAPVPVPASVAPNNAPLPTQVLAAAASSSMLVSDQVITPKGVEQVQVETNTESFRTSQVEDLPAEKLAEIKARFAAQMQGK